MTKRPGPSTQLLCAVVLLNALGIQCATHVIDRGSREKVRSDVVSQEQRLELVSEPTQGNPVAEFRSLEEIRYRETFQLTTVFKREPASWLSLGLLGAGAGAFLLSRDMQNRGYPEYAKPTLVTAFVAAGGAVVCYLLPRFDFRKVERTREARIDLKPLPIDVSIGSKPLASLLPDAQCYANLSLPTYLNDFARGTDHELTIRMRDRPERTIQLVIAASLIDTLNSIRQRQEELRRKEEEEAERERLLREGEEQRREQAKVAARSRDVVISFGMTDATLVALVGEPTYKSDRQEYSGAHRLLVWEYADKTFLRCLCEYSHVTGTYNLLAISGLSKPEDERKVLADGLATIFGYWPGDQRTDGKYPETATGEFKRTNRRWYYEYYFQGQRLWNEF